MSAREGRQVQLIPLSFEHLEVVRNWRNQNHVRNMMEYQELISTQEQKAWFSNLKHQENKYFVFATSTDLVGLTHLKNISEETAEAGLFVGNEKYIGTGVAFYASIELLDLAFFEMKLQKLFAKVNKDNIDAIRYNTSLGFSEEKKLNESFIQLAITQDTYVLKREKLIKALLLNK